MSRARLIGALNAFMEDMTMEKLRELWSTGPGPRDAATVERALSRVMDQSWSPEWAASEATGVDVSPGARMDRIRDMGFDKDLYHGTRAVQKSNVKDELPKYLRDYGITDDSSHYTDWNLFREVMNQVRNDDAFPLGAYTDFDKFKHKFLDKADEPSLAPISTYLGPHLAEDPRVSEAFTKIDQGSHDFGEYAPRILPVKMRGQIEDVPQWMMLERHKEGRGGFIPQSVQYGEKPNLAYEWDDKAVANYVMEDLFQDNPDLFVHWMKNRFGGNDPYRLKYEDLMTAYNKLKNFEPVLPTFSEMKSLGGVASDHTHTGFHGYLQNFGEGMAFPEMYSKIISNFYPKMRQRGVTGLRYINTSRPETEHASSPLSYIALDPAAVRSRFAAFNPNWYDVPGLMKKRGGPAR